MLTLAVACTAAVAGTTTVFAGAFAPGTAIQLPDNPLGASPATCAQVDAQQQALGSKLYPGAEVEPSVAADPLHPGHLIGAFQQDRWNDGGANGETTVVSTNGGTTWTPAGTQPKFSLCEGAAPGAPGGLNRASDPWVSIGPDGTAYQVSLSFNANGPGFGGTSSVVASTSTDGGMTWGATRNVILDPSLTVLNDKEAVTADPKHPGTAYVVWDRLISPSVHANPTAFQVTPAFRGPAMFSKTTDFGQTWSTPTVLYDPGAKSQTIGNQIVVEPDGTLVDGVDVINTKGGKGNNGRSLNRVAVLRSTDGGSTWSAPTFVSPIQEAPVSIGAVPVRTSGILPEFAVDPSSGTLYATWQDGRFQPGNVAHVAFSQSTNGGVNWSTPIQIDQAPAGVPAFTPVVHSTGSTIGVTYYDFGSATAASPGLTDELIVHCHVVSATSCTDRSSWSANGATVLDDSSAGARDPFDMTTAPIAEGYFTGDYEGLTSTGSTFDALFVMARPRATAGATDPFFNTAS